MDISNENQIQISQLRELKELPVFKLFVKELDDIIEEAEKVIYAVGADHDRIYTDRDLAIVKRDDAMRLKDLPDLMIKTLSGTGTENISNPDAFEGENEIVENDEIDKIFQDDYNK